MNKIEVPEESILLHEHRLADHDVRSQGSISIALSCLAHEIISSVEPLEALERRSLILIPAITHDKLRTVRTVLCHRLQPCVRGRLRSGLGHHKPLCLSRFDTQRHGELLTAHIA